MFTNAMINRREACRMFEAGLTPAQIAAEYPRVFKLVGDKLGQRYSKAATDALHRRDPIARDCGQRETDLVLDADHVTAFIQRSA